MPLTVNDFLTNYSAGVNRDMLTAFETALENRIDRDQDNEFSASTYTVQMRQNLWKYGENGILQTVPFEESDAETVMENMLQGALYVLPGIDADGRADVTKMHALSATEDGGKYYVQVMDAAEAKKAYENKPVKPTFIDRLVDFFCRLVGKRDMVCALWDKANMISSHAKEFADNDKKIAEKISLSDELLGKDYARPEQNLSDAEKSMRLKQAEELKNAKERTAFKVEFDAELTDWYMAMYANSHEMFPTFISDEAEYEMTVLDQQALAFAEGKIKYAVAPIKLVDSTEADHYQRKLDFEGAHKRFDVRVNTVTTLAFALTADQNLSAEDVFKFLGGEDVPGTEGLKEKMDAEIAKLNDAETRNSPEMKALIQKGTARMCTLLENQQDLQSGISYQLGRVLQRNLVAFNSPRDIAVDLELSPVAKQIVKLQDDIINSYNSDILQGFALHGEMGSEMTKLQAFGLLPANALGQTNAAFLEKLSQQPAENRLQFLKSNLHVLQEMNENLSNYVFQRAKEDNCSWLENPENLKAALNGGMVKEYHEAVLQSLRETGKMPVFENALDRLMADDSFDMETWEELAHDKGKEVKEEEQPMINIG
jgi:hypothetical protein